MANWWIDESYYPGPGETPKIEFNFDPKLYETRPVHINHVHYTSPSSLYSGTFPTIPSAPVIFNYEGK